MDEGTSDLIAVAKAFAIGAHEAVGQRRKYTGEPYWHHPRDVAELVTTLGRPALDLESAIAAAWLHDVVEDTAVTLDVIDTMFGHQVGRLVGELTDISRPEDGNRAARKAIDRAHSAAASPLGQTIKVADLIDNSRTITAHDPDFARVYMREKRALLEVLTKADARLITSAWDIIRSYEASVASLESDPRQEP